MNPSSAEESMPHNYDTIVAHLAAAFQEIRRLGLADVLPKGGVGAILLAHCLGHELVPGDKGADAQDAMGKKYEYKVSITNQFNFHFGARKAKESPSDVVRRHFQDIEGAYCALREGEIFKQIVYCPAAALVDNLCDHFAATNGGQLNKNFRLESFANLPGAVYITLELLNQALQ
jgi:hypothetical protein